MAMIKNWAHRSTFAAQILSICLVIITSSTYANTAFIAQIPRRVNSPFSHQISHSAGRVASSPLLFMSAEPTSKPSIVSSTESESSNEEVVSDVKEEITTNENGADVPITVVVPPTKLRQLKDRMWVRETLEELTSSEFACSLTPGENTSSKKRAVDFEALLQKLDRRIEEMCVEGRDVDPLCFIVSVNGMEQCFLLRDGEGMGSVVYTQEQRESLLRRVLATREKLMKAMSGTITTPSDNLDQIRTELQEKMLIAEPTDMLSENTTYSFSSEDDKLDSNTETFPKLYVRDDGTVDWEGALQDKEALKLFGNSVWARINGQDPTLVDEEGNLQSEESSHGDEKGIRAKIVETEEIKEMRKILEDFKKELEEMEAEHTKLLNSAIPPTTPNPTVNMASVAAPLRAQIKSSTALLEQKRDAVTFATVNFELERIFTYLEAELGNTFSKGYIPLQDRLAVAEFGLLESQIAALNQQHLSETQLDRDVLQVLMEQINDFKRRLGIDYYVNVNPTWDGETLKRWSSDLIEKSKEGLGFYVKGCKLLWNDVVFCFWLLNRAIQGYTLKPREVKTLRRTFSDIITFIPFVIILIIPLSPVGHVFVFGAIQRFFPDFFPSMFTERRQNLLELYESTEYSEITINESLQDKVMRFNEASFLIMANSVKDFFTVGDDDKKTKEDRR